MHGDVLKGHLDLLLLTALEQGPGHGYALIEGVRARSASALDLNEGSVYPALHRLEAAGLVASRWATEAGRRRRVYRLTRRGRSAAERARGEWQRFAQAIELSIGAG